MPAARTIRLTLTGPFEGKTRALNGFQFTKGVLLYTGSETELAGLTKYFVRSYQAQVENVLAADEQPVDPEPIVDEDEDEPVVDDEAIRVDDSDVLTDDEIAEKEDAPDEPNARQATIIAAVNCVEKEKWVDKQAKTPRPKVADIQKLAKDPTISVAEIVEVIQTWLS